MDTNTAANLLHIREDLLDDSAGRLELSATGNKASPAPSTKKAKQARSKSITDEPNTFEKLTSSAVKTLGCAHCELIAWLNQSPNTPKAVQQNALRLISKHELDPFADEISINQYEDSHWQAFITIDGWAIWMGCAIYRNDRVVPIEVKEYLCEIQTEHSIWKDMPRRMLRHRVIAQCARLAFGVSVPEQLRKNKLSSKAGNNARLIPSNPQGSQSNILKAQLKRGSTKS